MLQLGRPGLTFQEKAELWKRWKAGESLSDIGRVLSCHPASVHGVLKRYGGFRPAERKRSVSALSLEEREEISRGLAAGLSLRSIALCVGCAPSTVSRELQRNGGAKNYRAARADDNAWQRACRPKPCRLKTNATLRTLVACKLQQNWSPQQIAGWLKRIYPRRIGMQISHETIYRTLFIQARGALKKELIRHLRSGRMMRRSKHSTTAGQTRGQIIDAVAISDRPASIEDRAVPGHWEGDLISGTHNSHIATLVERKSRYTLLVKLTGKDTATVVHSLSRAIRRLPNSLRRSLTWDRGTELAAHKTLTIATDIRVYFCDPQSPWQRGTNENTNGLLRQYFPDGTDLSQFSQRELDRVAKQLNTRPRKTLRYRTPAVMLERLLH